MLQCKWKKEKDEEVHDRILSCLPIHFWALDLGDEANLMACQRQLNRYLKTSLLAFLFCGHENPVLLDANLTLSPIHNQYKL